MNEDEYYPPVEPMTTHAEGGDSDCEHVWQAWSTDAHADHQMTGDETPTHLVRRCYLCGMQVWA